ncbi:hypothetical protein N599_18940 [Saccharopolyspora erythraea D]|nr:hypothetical protein N599_18940 [Saccharopolyspora erythraea D]
MQQQITQLVQRQPARRQSGEAISVQADRMRSGDQQAERATRGVERTWLTIGLRIRGVSVHRSSLRHEWNKTCHKKAT